MLRKIASVSLAVSFIAMSTSGLMMFFVSKPSFTIQMHPVHKLFGLLTIVATIVHLSFNFRSITNYLRTKTVFLYSCGLVAVLVLLYGAAINNEIPAELAVQMDNAAARVEQEH